MDRSAPAPVRQWPPRATARLQRAVPGWRRRAGLCPVAGARGRPPWPRWVHAEAPGHLPARHRRAAGRWQLVQRQV